MTLALAQVRDLDCLVSLAPLRLDMPSPNRYATGIAAILRRVLYSWCRDASINLPALEGTRWEPRSLMRYRNELEGLARAVEFVRAASVPMTLAGREQNTLIISGSIALIDGLTYPLEVSAADAPTAILAIGAQQA